MRRRRVCCTSCLGVLILCLIQVDAQSYRDGDVLSVANCQALVTDDLRGRWSSQELWVWERICAGEVADLSLHPNSPGIDCDVGAAEHWPNIREITADFIQSIRVNGDLQGVVSKRGLRLRCGKISGAIDISNLRSDGDIWFDNMYFGRDVVAHEVDVGGSLSFLGSRISGDLEAERIVVGKSLFLGADVEGTVEMPEAHLGHSFAIRSGSFGGKVGLNRLVVGGDVSFWDSRFDGDLHFSKSKVGGDISMRQSFFSGSVIADRLKLGGDLFFGHGKARSIATVTSTVYRDVRFRNVEIDGDLDLSGVSADGTLDFTRGIVRGDLVLGWDPICSIGSCRLVLRDLSVYAVQDYIDSNCDCTKDCRLSGSWSGLDGRLVLVGFTYRILEQSEAVYDRYDRPDEWWRCWLENQENPGNEHLPMPYLQLAAYLRRVGYDEKADRVMVAAKKHYRKAKTTGGGRRALLLLESITVGYGYRGWQSVLLLLGLVLLGTVLPPMSLKGESWYRKLLYSVDKAIPLISLDEKSKKVEQEDGTRGYFYFLAIAGFALVSIFVASMIGIVR